MRRVREVCPQRDANRALGAQQFFEGEPAVEAIVQPLILLDLVMPEVGGWQFRAAQMEDDTLARIPVVLIGARSDIEVHAKNLRALGCIPYPATVRELRRDVDRWWDLVQSSE